MHQHRANGARHAVTRLYLGARVDPEATANPAGRKRRRYSGNGDDEDGVAFNLPSAPDSAAGVSVTASLPAGWMPGSTSTITAVGRIQASRSLPTSC